MLACVPPPNRFLGFTTEQANFGKTPFMISLMDEGHRMPIYSKAIFFLWFTLAALQSNVSGQATVNQPVKFDVPIVVAADVVTAEVAEHFALAEQLMQVVIPVSSEIHPQSKHDVETFRFDAFWGHTAYTIHDYFPKTQTFSAIQSEITIETVHETKSGLGLNLNADLESFVSGEATAESGTSDLVKKEFKQLPDQSILVASGTSHRGTGVFFRFHRSSQTSLEGGRDLMVQFRVPQNWRAGVLRVNCFAVGTTSMFGGWENPYEMSRTFVVPVYRRGDQQAKAAAVKLAEAEQRLRRSWRSYQAAKPITKPLSFSTFLVSTSNATKKLPSQWAHLLIQTGNDDYLKKYRSQLPAELAASADSFVVARQAFYQLEDR